MSTLTTTTVAALVQGDAYFETEEIYRRQLRWTGFGTRTQPMRDLPSKYKVTDPEYPSCRYQYGFGVTYQWLINYARHHNLIEEPKGDDPEDNRASLVVYSLINTARHLRYICRTRIKYACPISFDYDVVFALYSNHTQEDEELEDKDHAEVVEILSKELECPEGPMWFEDAA
ncbi:hypothetical protein EV421DRAFT_1801573 [Armillaria borealis]|uniref:Uncharacterized protein n=1 Tax=Armillaria borealis TaxID=47425 RepID=A0AA39MRX5_9AGAR|nr:hypothetical protein EV421DRAFT_1801573 [Armillaria borealis]